MPVDLEIPLQHCEPGGLPLVCAITGATEDVSWETLELTESELSFTGVDALFLLLGQLSVTRDETTYPIALPISAPASRRRRALRILRWLALGAALLAIPFLVLCLTQLGSAFRIWHVSLALLPMLAPLAMQALLSRSEPVLLGTPGRCYPLRIPSVPAAIAYAEAVLRAEAPACRLG